LESLSEALEGWVLLMAQQFYRFWGSLFIGEPWERSTNSFLVMLDWLSNSKGPGGFEEEFPRTPEPGRIEFRRTTLLMSPHSRLSWQDKRKIWYEVV
jgi:hypothetical protein